MEKQPRKMREILLIRKEKLRDKINSSHSIQERPFPFVIEVIR